MICEWWHIGFAYSLIYGKVIKVYELDRKQFKTHHDAFQYSFSYMNHRNRLAPGQ